jgi:hypothetical protein
LLVHFLILGLAGWTLVFVRALPNLQRIENFLPSADFRSMPNRERVWRETNPPAGPTLICGTAVYRSWAMTSAEILCWVDIGDGAHLPAVLEHVTATGAKFAMEAFVQLPPACAVYFSPDRRVGRKCKVISQDDVGVVVVFEGRISQRPSRDILKI